MNHTEATQYIKATLAAFGPGEAISMTQDTWVNLHEAMSVLIDQPEQRQEPTAWTATRLWNRKDTWTCPADIEKDLLDGRVIPAQPTEARACEVFSQGEWVLYPLSMAEEAKQRGWTVRYLLAEQPAQQQEPVAAECKFDREQKWVRCEIAHHNLVQSEPHNWPDYQTRLLYTSPPAQQQEPTATELSNGLALALHDAVLIRIGGSDEATKQACARIDKLVEKYLAEHPDTQPAQQDRVRELECVIADLKAECQALRAQRKPLTDEQVWDAYMEISAEFDCNVIDLVEFARAIEAAHGIKGDAC